jgi:hypothetical protein
VVCPAQTSAFLPNHIGKNADQFGNSAEPVPFPFFYLFFSSSSFSLSRGMGAHEATGSTKGR